MATPAPAPRLLLLRTGNIITSSLPPPTPTSTTSTELLTTLLTSLQHARSHSPSSWTKLLPTGTLLAPATLSPTPPSLSESRDAYDLTVKLFYLPNLPVEDRNQHTLDAVKLVCEELGVERIDLLNVAFPEVAFDAEDEVPRDTIAGAQQEEEREVDEETKSFLITYSTLESLVHSNLISRIGLSEFGSSRLSRLLRGLGFSPSTTNTPTTAAPSSTIKTTTTCPPRVRPSVVQINVRDCCVVPRELIHYAKREGIQLLTHNDSGEVLTAPGLQRVISESGIFESMSMPKATVIPLWVVKYTAVVRDRSVVENKGYIAMASIR
ncbi:hypothetical protein L211DRAFT_869141 [Terfezia boudieri ATCC MYA-4762]|uniref:GCS light chain n=1 Tax=Terfezia boudieri ATCC MYA-4762 TaxID=1051890 RepID=A0A3N4LIQ4_9PEZI|nr:hypothetical protein L211DRAFT_869141 [Terfezia boudieri ATCC MYA-4762]